MKWILMHRPHMSQYLRIIYTLLPILVSLLQSFEFDIHNYYFSLSGKLTYMCTICYSTYYSASLTVILRYHFIMSYCIPNPIYYLINALLITTRKLSADNIHVKFWSIHHSTFKPLTGIQPRFVLTIKWVTRIVNMDVILPAMLSNII